MSRVRKSLLIYLCVLLTTHYVYIYLGFYLFLNYRTQYSFINMAYAFRAYSQFLTDAARVYFCYSL